MSEEQPSGDKPTTGLREPHGEVLPPQRRRGEPHVDADDAAKGPSLTLLYAILAFALAAAIGLALLIVLPFYRRR